MRIIKTALAAMISAYLALWLDLDSPFFASVAAVITMQGSLVDSFRMASNRILGTIFGALMGIVGAYLVPGNPLVLGVGIALIIYLADKLKWHKAIMISCIVFASIMFSVEEANYFYASLNRVLDTSVGILVAVLLNLAISRPDSRNLVLDNAKDLVKKCKDALGILICNEGEVDLDALGNQLHAIESALPVFKQESKLHIASQGKDFDADDVKNQVEDLYWHVAFVAKLNHTGKLNSSNASTVNRIYNVNLSADENQDQSDIVFNYHVASSLQLLDSLSDSLGLESVLEAGEE